MRRFGIVCAAIVLGATGCAADSATDRLDWHPCPALPQAPAPSTPGLSCTELSVPLDYEDPTGPSIDIAVSKLSTGPGHPMLVSNPGGPGASGLFNTIGVDSLTGGKLREHFDLVDFDPRGVGRSSPVSCRLSDDMVRRSVGPTVPTTFDADAATAAAVSAACLADGGPTLAHVTTADTARDLEQLRKALGQQRISLVGSSYGSELAVTYATMFPAATAQIVLDSASDVTRPWSESRRDSAPAADARFGEVATAIAANDAQWHLGTTASAVRDEYLRTLDTLAERPVQVAGQTVDAATLQASRVMPALGDDRFVDPLAAALAFLAGAPGAPSASELIAQLAKTDGSGGGLANGQSLEQNVSANTAVRCNDAAWPHGIGTYRAAMADENARFPVTRGMFSSIHPCATWPSPTAAPQPPVTDDGWTEPPNILILQNTRDYRAHPAGVTNTRAALGRRAELLAVDDYRHIVIGHNACATAAAVQWLIESTVKNC